MKEIINKKGKTKKIEKKASQSNVKLGGLVCNKRAPVLNNINKNKINNK